MNNYIFISLCNNCSGEIEFKHQKGLKMDVQMYYLSQLYKVLFIVHISFMSILFFCPSFLKHLEITDAN